MKTKKKDVPIHIQRMDMPEKFLVGGNALTHLLHMKDTREIADNYFRRTCPVVKAIIADMMKDNSRLYNLPDGCRLQWHQGVYPVHVKTQGVRVFNDFSVNNKKPSSYVIAEFEVDIWEDDLNHERREKVQFSIPSELFVKFTKEAFDDFARAEKAKREKERRAEDEKVLKLLIKKWPSTAATILSKV